MYHDYTQEELRTFCRQNIENFEIWARNLIHEKMSANYGPDYINYKVSDENFLIKREIREHVLGMLKKEPSRYNRAVDTLYVDHIIYFLCHDKLYPTLFKEILDETYPDGKNEVRTLLSRLIPIRNPLSHSNPISIHQAEQAICYTHDFIEGVKTYYKKKGEEKMWNVPTIIKIKDSLGNVFENFKANNNPEVIVIPQHLNCGETYSIEVDVDPSFSSSEYDIVWEFRHCKKYFKNNKKISITFTPKDVGDLFAINCEIISKKEWHRYHFYDFRALICLTVLPPRN